MYVVVLLALGLETPSLKIAGALLIVMFTAALPISLNGWGIRELSAVTVLGAIGIDSASALAAGLVAGLLRRDRESGSPTHRGQGHHGPAGRRLGLERAVRRPAGQEGRWMTTKRHRGHRDGQDPGFLNCAKVWPVFCALGLPKSGGPYIEEK